MTDVFLCWTLSCRFLLTYCTTTHVYLMKCCMENIRPAWWTRSVKFVLSVNPLLPEFNTRQMRNDFFKIEIKLFQIRETSQLLKPEQRYVTLTQWQKLKAKIRELLAKQFPSAVSLSDCWHFQKQNNTFNFESKTFQCQISDTDDEVQRITIG